MGFELPKAKSFEERVFNLTNAKEFVQIALELFHFQYGGNLTYKAYCDALRINAASVKAIEQIPFLPIRFFKSMEIKTGSFMPGVIFESSGTTGITTSRHYVKETALYEKSFLAAFDLFYGNPGQYCILGLLPSYLEQGASSLVYMVNRLIDESRHPSSGFYLYDHQQLHSTLLGLESAGQPTILFGVSYAVLDFAAAYPMALKNTIVIETGGMKGRKKEVTKAELYDQLRTAFHLREIHSEYGMTELLSQAYAINGRYKTPPWMKILLREETDPFQFTNRTGVINLIDLANIWSCCFIATDDRGRLNDDGSFEVLGRIDHSDVRGCSQLVL